jgi:hypothetical protein
MQKEKAMFEAIPNWPAARLEWLQSGALRWIKPCAGLVPAIAVSGPSSPPAARSFIDHSTGIWNFPRQVPSAFRVRKVKVMKRSLLAFAAAATLAASAIAPAPAQAQRGVAAGVAAGLIGGAIVGGALASPYYYRPGPGYYYGPGYYPPRYYGPGYVADDYYGGCVWQKQRFWDGYAWRVRRVRVCG